VRWGLVQDAPLSPQPGTRLVAVASSSGTQVDLAFEETAGFYLYDISPETTRFIGRQACPRPGTGATAADTVRLLRDCDVVLCTGIGAYCRQLLDGLGVACCVEQGGRCLEQAVVSAGRPVLRD
jgi:hypothetical protein